jgi:hypothetical protein
MKTVADALALAAVHGVKVSLAPSGRDLEIEADSEPPAAVIAVLSRGKFDIVAALRRQAEEERRRLIIRWVNNHFMPHPAGVCCHCGGGPRERDTFVQLFCGDDRADIHHGCWSAWQAAQEALAIEALGLDRR